MSHSLDQHEFGTGNGFGCRSSATDVNHAIRKAVDYQGRNLEITQAFGAIAGGDCRDRLASHADLVVAPVVCAARTRPHFILIARISR
jgi:hypothetical protein